MVRNYPALIERVDGGYSIVFPDFPQCKAMGATVEQTMAHGRDAILLELVAMLADSGKIPASSPVDIPIPEWLNGDTPWARVTVPVEWLPTPDLI